MPWASRALGLVLLLHCWVSVAHSGMPRERRSMHMQQRRRRLESGDEREGYSYYHDSEGEQYKRSHGRKGHYRKGHDHDDQHDGYDGDDNSGAGDGGNGNLENGGCTNNGSVEVAAANLETATAFLSCTGSQEQFSIENCGEYVAADVRAIWLNYGQVFIAQGPQELFETMYAIFYADDDGNYSVGFSDIEASATGQAVYSQMSYRMKLGTSWAFMQKMQFNPEGRIAVLESSLDVASLNVGSGRFFASALTFVTEMFSALGAWGEDPEALSELVDKRMADESVTLVQLFYDTLGQKAGSDAGPVEFYGKNGAFFAFKPLFELDWTALTHSVTSMAAGTRVKNGERRSVATITTSVTESRWFCNKAGFSQPEWTGTFVIGTNDRGLINFLEFYTDFGGMADWAAEVCGPPGPAFFEG